MRKSFCVSILLAVVLLGSSSCIMVPFRGSGTPIQITIFHVNDTHGVGLLPKPGESKSRVACAATKIRQLRKESKADRVFLVHCGDLLHVHDLAGWKDPLAEKSRGAVEVEILNLLSVDAMVAGNHEFDHGESYTQELFAKAKFPVLAANVIRNDNQKPLLGDYKIWTVSGAKLALFGVSPGGADQWIAKGKTITATSQMDVAKALVPELRKEADAIVMLAHLPHKPQSPSPAKITDEQIVEAVPGIDAVLGAHSHTLIEKGMKVKDSEGRDVLIAQAHWHWLYIGQVDLTLEKTKEGYRVTKSEAMVHPVDCTALEEDPEVLALITKAKETYLGKEKTAKP